MKRLIVSMVLVAALGFVGTEYAPKQSWYRGWSPLVRNPRRTARGLYGIATRRPAVSIGVDLYSDRFAFPVQVSSVGGPSVDVPQLIAIPGSRMQMPVTLYKTLGREKVGFYDPSRGVVFRRRPLRSDKPIAILQYKPLGGDEDHLAPIIPWLVSDKYIGMTVPSSSQLQRYFRFELPTGD